MATKHRMSSPRSRKAFSPDAAAVVLRPAWLRGYLVTSRADATAVRRATARANALPAAAPTPEVRRTAWSLN